MRRRNNQQKEHSKTNEHIRGDSLSDLDAAQRRSAWFRFFLRTTVFLCLAVTVVVVGFFSYTSLITSQRRSQREQYDAIAKKIKSTILSSIANKQRSLAIISAHALHFCPNQSSWPLCNIPFDFYQQTFSPLDHIALSRTIAFAPRISPSQMTLFENFAYNFYAQSGHPELGISDFGKGIFTVNLTTGEHVRLTNTTLGQRKYDMLLVVLQTTNSSYRAYQDVLMMDLYSLSDRTAVVDFVTDCVEVQKRAGNKCTGVSKFLVAVTDVPNQELSMRASSIVVYPIIARDAPHTLVGILRSGLTWDMFLSLAANERVSGIMVVLSNDLHQAYSFLYKSGRAVQLGASDLHDHSYDFQKVSFQATYFGGAVNYTVSIYPTREWVSLFENDLPIIACVSGVGIVVFSSLVFIFYDFFTNREAIHRERLLRTKRRYVRFISHEMRTPLNVVHLGFNLLQHELTAKLDFLDALRNESSPAKPKPIRVGKKDLARPRVIKALEEWKDVVKEIIGNTNTSIDILNDLINSDKLDAGQLTLQKESILMSTMMGHVQEIFLEKARNVSLIFSPPAVVPGHDVMMDIDRQKIENILSRIIANAVIYTPPEGHITVSVTWQAEWHGWISSCFSHRPGKNNRNDNLQTGMINISVKDTGCGISKEQLERIYRGTALFDTDELRAGKGSGLGLWIARGILRLHGGQLSISSPGVDLGAEVVLSLPATLIPRVHDDELSASMLAEEGKQESAPAPASQLEPSQRFPRVLVVDDSKPTCKMLCRTLTKSGFTASQCHDGDECVEFMQKVLAGEYDAVDLILLDSEMPRMNGPETARTLRAMGIAVPIIGVTGHTLAEDLERFVDSGATRVLMKPVTLEAVNSILKQV